MDSDYFAKFSFQNRQHEKPIKKIITNFNGSNEINKGLLI